MKLESNLIHLMLFINDTKIVSQRAQRAERAGPMPLTRRAGPGRKKSARAHL